MAKQIPNIRIATLDEYKKTAVSLLQQAQHSVEIFSQNLEPEIFNHPIIEQAMIRVAKSHPGTRIRILVQDLTSAAQNGHCLIRLAQALTSSVFIHRPSEACRNERRGFVIVDQTAFIHRVSAHDRNYKASANYHSPREAAKLGEFFNKIWEHSSPEIQTRRLYV